MKTLIVVPARYASTRFPGKPLVELTGADGKTKSLIQRSWEAAMAVENVDVVVATDDDRIKDAADDSFATETGADMATPVLRCDPETIAAFKSDRAAGQVGGTTAVFDKNNKALYFSKEVLPYSNKTDAPIYHHVGIYAYRPDALTEYMSWPEGPLETEEGLEQLRFLENGRHIQCVEVDGKGRAFWEVNNPSDVPRVNMMLQKLGIV